MSDEETLQSWIAKDVITEGRDVSVPPGPLQLPSFLCPPREGISAGILNKVGRAVVVDVQLAPRSAAIPVTFPWWTMVINTS